MVFGSFKLNFFLTSVTPFFLSIILHMHIKNLKKPDDNYQLWKMCISQPNFPPFPIVSERSGHASLRPVMPWHGEFCIHHGQNAVILKDFRELLREARCGFKATPITDAALGAVNYWAAERTLLLCRRVKIDCFESTLRSDLYNKEP